MVPESILKLLFHPPNNKIGTYRRKILFPRKRPCKIYIGSESVILKYLFHKNRCIIATVQ